MRKQKKRTDHDANWKEIITHLWEDFVLFFLPEAHPLIDFSSKPDFLEQELHNLIADKLKSGKKIADKLVKVYLKDGREQWILLHIEVQANRGKEFTKRMFVYFYKIFDKYDVNLTSIAIFTGDSVPKVYDKFEYDFLGTKNVFEFNTYLAREVEDDELLSSDNPFALAVLAAKYWSRTKKNDEDRYQFKVRLIRLAIRRNYSREKIVVLLGFVHNLLILPEEFEDRLFSTLNLLKMESTKSSLLNEDFFDFMFRLIKGEKFDEWNAKREQEMERKKVVALARMEKEKLEAIEKIKEENVEAIEKIKEENVGAIERMKEEKVESIKKLLGKNILSVGEIAEILNVSQKKVRAIKKRL